MSNSTQQAQYVAQLEQLSTELLNAIHASDTPLVASDPLLTTYGQLMNVIKITDDYFTAQSNAIDTDTFVHEQVSRWCDKLDAYIPAVSADLAAVVNEYARAIVSAPVHDIHNKPTI